MYLRILLIVVLLGLDPAGDKVILHRVGQGEVVVPAKSDNPLKLQNDLVPGRDVVGVRGGQCNQWLSENGSWFADEGDIKRKPGPERTYSKRNFQYLGERWVFNQPSNLLEIRCLRLHTEKKLFVNRPRIHMFKGSFRKCEETKDLGMEKTSVNSVNHEIYLFIHFIKTRL